MSAPAARPSTSAASHEELANGAIHGVGAALSIAGLTLLVTLAAGRDARHLASALVFGVALLLLYSASTVYHLATGPRLKHAFKVVDHACIYVLIAGTYTPFALVTLRGATGWWLFGLVWTLAIAGVALETAWVHRPKAVAALVYLAMGWLVVGAHRPLFARLPDGGLALLLAGGLLYSFGTIFYVMHRVRYMHSVWHAFVLAGSMCHFLAVARYVLPAAA
jgi:hemolysin III